MSDLTLYLVVAADTRDLAVLVFVLISGRPLPQVEITVGEEAFVVTTTVHAGKRIAGILESRCDALRIKKILTLKIYNNEKNCHFNCNYFSNFPELFLSGSKVRYGWKRHSF